MDFEANKENAALHHQLLEKTAHSTGVQVEDLALNSVEQGSLVLNIQAKQSVVEKVEASVAAKGKTELSRDIGQTVLNV